MEHWLTATPYPGMILRIVLYISDYYLTLKSAKGFEEIGHFHFEKSFELTPQFQKDVDAQERISRKHITLLVVYTFAILLIWWIFAYLLKAEWLYSLYLGMFLLLEIAVHFRHLRNLSLIRIVKKEGGVDGEITYLQRLSYRASASEFNLTAVLFLMTAAITFSPFFLGGAIMCFGTGIKHNRYAGQITKSGKTINAGKNANPS